MHGLKVVFTVIAMLVLLTACGANVRYGTVKIDSTPPGAEVVNLKDSSQLGVTPVKVLFSGEAGTSEKITVQLRKVGYLDRITSFWINMKHSSPQTAAADAIDVRVELEKKK